MLQMSFVNISNFHEKMSCKKQSKTEKILMVHGICGAVHFDETTAIPHGYNRKFLKKGLS